MKLIHKFITMKWKLVLPAITAFVLCSNLLLAQPEKAEQKIKPLCKT